MSSHADVKIIMKLINKRLLLFWIIHDMVYQARQLTCQTVEELQPAHFAARPWISKCLAPLLDVERIFLLHQMPRNREDHDLAYPHLLVFCHDTAVATSVL